MESYKPSVFLLIGLLLLAGCTGTTKNSVPQPAPSKTTCTNITQQVPITTQQCDNVSYTEQVCNIHTINYTISNKTKTDLCAASDNCTGFPLSQCPSCTSAMTRCTITIQNLDPQQTGNWDVGANFTIQSSTFVKNPMTKSILPNQLKVFDFFQIYGSVGTPASCDLYVINPPQINDCHQETRNKVVCNNVTTMQTTEKDVCS